MHFTLWPSHKATTGKYADVSWESFLSFVSSPAVATDKNALRGWSPVKFRENRRGVEYVESVSAIVLDDDSSGLSTDALARLWSGFAGAIHTSHSHTLEKPKHRVILRVSRDMTRDEHARMWRYVSAMATAKGQTLDEQTRDASRLWYVPAQRPGALYDWREIR